MMTTYLHVSTSTVYLLLVLDRELDNQRLALVGELVELGGHGVKLSILGGLKTCVEEHKFFHR